MAKDKKAEEIKEEPKAEEQLIVAELPVPERLDFVCRMCLSLQGKPGKRSSDCIMKNATGVLCDNMQNLKEYHIRLERENDLHNKYLRAFNTQPYYTQEQMHELYIKLVERKDMNEEEFLDYCRNAGYLIV